jgi:hypothetical protein
MDSAGDRAAQANARLIAAAPELLAACRRAEECYAMLYPNGSGAESELLQTLRAAIGRAAKQ